jgi:hypothetical protein
MEDSMRAEAKTQPTPNPDFELRAMAWLQVRGEGFVPVFIYVGVGVFGQPGVGVLYGPPDVLYRAYKQGHAILKVAGVEFRAKIGGYISENGWVNFERHHLFRALARGTTHN